MNRPVFTPCNTKALAILRRRLSGDTHRQVAVEEAVAPRQRLAVELAVVLVQAVPGVRVADLLKLTANKHTLTLLSAL